MKKRILILDIDGTLTTFNPTPLVDEAVKNGYDRYGAEIWDLFEEPTYDMTIAPHAIPYKHYNEFTESYDKVVIITSRLTKWRKPTIKWLKKWGFHFDDLYMRLGGTEYISSKDVKRLYVEHIKLRWRIKHITAIDDDPQVLQSYREYGMIVFEAPNEWEKALTYHRRINTMIRKKE